MRTHGIPPDFRDGVRLFILTTIIIHYRVSPEFIGSRNCASMAFTNVHPLVQGPAIIQGFGFCDPIVHDNHYQTSDRLTKPTPPVMERVGIDDKESTGTSSLLTAP